MAFAGLCRAKISGRRVDAQDVDAIKVIQLHTSFFIDKQLHRFQVNVKASGDFVQRLWEQRVDSSAHALWDCISVQVDTIPQGLKSISAYLGSLLTVSPLLAYDDRSPKSHLQS